MKKVAVTNKPKLKKRTKNCFFGKGIDFENAKEVVVDAIFKINLETLELVRRNAKVMSRPKPSFVLALNNSRCQVILSDYEIGYELSSSDEYDITFKRNNKPDYKLIVCGTVLELI